MDAEKIDLMLRMFPDVNRRDFLRTRRRRAVPPRARRAEARAGPDAEKGAPSSTAWRALRYPDQQATAAVTIA